MSPLALRRAARKLYADAMNHPKMKGRICEWRKLPVSVRRQWILDVYYMMKAEMIKQQQKGSHK